MDDITDLIKFIVMFGIIVLAYIGFAFLMEADKLPTKITYYLNDTEIPAIEYNNEIYLKKGE